MPKLSGSSLANQTTLPSIAALVGGVTVLGSMLAMRRGDGQRP
jgi:hypothetical protein